MKKYYSKPEATFVELQAERIMAGSNSLGNEDNGEGGAKGTLFDMDDEFINIELSE